MTPRALLELIAILILVGGAEPALITLSHWTVDRRMKQAQLDARLATRYQDFGFHLTLHFDGVRGALSFKQGNSVEEHLGVTLT